MKNSQNVLNINKKRRKKGKKKRQKKKAFDSNGKFLVGKKLPQIWSLGSTMDHGYQVGKKDRDKYIYKCL